MSRIELAWQTRGVLACLLWPLSLIYRLVTALRRLGYQRGWIDITPVSLPVVVVGNISVGGTGKTPLCAHLVHMFHEAGWRPGIVSRGYGGERRELPHLIAAGDTADQVGDEPLMLFEQTGVPVCVCVKRALAVEYLAAQTDINIVFSDDGLQHLAMPRVVEIVVVDGRRGLGNGWLLPAGPLREPPERLLGADVVAVQKSEALHASLTAGMLKSNSEQIDDNQFELVLDEVVSLADGQRVSLESFAGQQVFAIAGIGHPERFFDALRGQGLIVTGVAKPDHHAFSHNDFTVDPFTADLARPVLVTSKDAIKIRSLGQLPVNVFEVGASVAPSEWLHACFSELERSLQMGHSRD